LKGAPLLHYAANDDILYHLYRALILQQQTYAAQNKQNPQRLDPSPTHIAINRQNSMKQVSNLPKYDIFGCFQDIMRYGRTFKELK
jgi:hypothetical protein